MHKDIKARSEKRIAASAVIKSSAQLGHCVGKRDAHHGRKRQ